MFIWRKNLPTITQLYLLGHRAKYGCQVWLRRNVNLLRACNETIDCCRLTMTEQKLLQLTIAKVSGTVFEGDVLSVTVPGIEGEMTLLANHQALMSPLKKGTILVKDEGNKEFTFSIEEGTLEISNNNATILIETTLHTHIHKPE